jgi:hypothetical protein
MADFAFVELSLVTFGADDELEPQPVRARTSAAADATARRLVDRRRTEAVADIRFLPAGVAVSAQSGAPAEERADPV